MVEEGHCEDDVDGLSLGQVDRLELLLGGDSIDIENLGLKTGHETGHKTGHDIGMRSGTRPNMVPIFVPRMSIESPPWRSPRCSRPSPR